MTDYVLPWDQPDDAAAREQSSRRRYAPGLWAQRVIPGEPPQMPPGFRGAFSCCTDCPRACCDTCPPNERWTRFHETTRQADKPATRRTWWARLMGRTPREIHE